MKVTSEAVKDLTNKLESYLSGGIPHDAIKNYAWELVDQSPNEPLENEKVYWSTIFTIIHLSDDEHWKEGCTQRNLNQLCYQLKVQYEH